MIRLQCSAPLRISITLVLQRFGYAVPIIYHILKIQIEYSCSASIIIVEYSQLQLIAKKVWKKTLDRVPKFL